MTISDADRRSFETLVRNEFAFLETDFDFRYAGTDSVGDDPRDSHVVSKYRRDEFRINVAWSPAELVLGVRIRVSNTDLGRREKNLYLEPFIEFSSGGEVVPVVPQIYPGMSLSRIAKTMREREQLFAGGFQGPLLQVAERLKVYLPGIAECPPERIREYQAWYQSRGKVA